MLPVSMINRLSICTTSCTVLLTGTEVFISRLCLWNRCESWGGADDCLGYVCAAPQFVLAESPPATETTPCPHLPMGSGEII